MREEKIETPDGVFFVRALTYGEVKKVLKNAGVTKIRMLGGEPVQWEIDIADLQYHLLLESVKDGNGEKISVEKLDSLTLDTINILTNKALELTPIFRLLGQA
ncbi:MAG: hypothetical protein QXF58_04230 [Desulfurococcaceae archaeon]